MKSHNLLSIEKNYENREQYNLLVLGKCVDFMEFLRENGNSKWHFAPCSSKVIDEPLLFGDFL